MAVFAEAFSKGWGVFFHTFTDPSVQHSIGMTLKVAALAVPLNTLFGVAAAWSVTRFVFPGRRFLISLIELPLWVSPVIGGLIYTLIFGIQMPLGAWLDERNIQIIFAYPGLVLATVFVTFPFVARVLIPLMEQQGQAEEEAAVSLGARGWQVFWRVTSRGSELDCFTEWFFATPGPWVNSGPSPWFPESSGIKPLPSPSKSKFSTLSTSSPRPSPSPPSSPCSASSP